MDGSPHNLFPPIGPTEMRAYIASGRAGLAGRKTRQNKSISKQMSASGPMFEPASSEDWKSVHQKEGAHYNTFYVNHHSGKSRASDLKSMAALRSFFPNGEANEMNFCLFSTSGVHGTYTTIEEVEADLDKPYAPEDDFDHSDESQFKHSDQVTFLIVQPRIVCLRYGNVLPKTKDDIDFLKKLRASSHEAVAKIGFQS